MLGVRSTAAALILFLSAYAFAVETSEIMGPPEPPVAALPSAYGPFAIEPKIEKRVRFWVDVYVKYHSWETVIHDTKYPQLVYSMVNTNAKGKGAVNAEKSRMLLVLKHLAEKQKEIAAGKLAREKLKADELRLLEIFEREGLAGEIAAAGNSKRVRGQAGLRDALEDALFVSGRYLPRMEKVFEHFDLPPEIAYLPFVESGFNKRAVSKVGASGIWQFMPYTGKLYLRVDEEVDERNDPMRAAEAAARLMRQNFSMLGAWPLAVTAYNHGAAGMDRAAREVGTKDIGDIIAKYESKSFGFASQNFYSCFLAALHVAKNSEQYLGMVPRANKLEFDEFVMPDYVALQTLLEKMEIDETTFHELNPALTKDVYEGRKYIPVGYTIRVPIEARKDFFSRYESIPADQKFAEQKKKAGEAPVLSVAGGTNPDSSEIMGPAPASVTGPASP